MKLVSPDALSELQRSILDGYSRFFPSGAVCVNVMLGAEPWDIRPLLLLLGKVSVARFSMSLTESVARSVASELEGFSVVCNNQQKVQLLPGEGRFMLLRPYFSDTLKDDIELGRIGGAGQRTELVRSLIRTLGDLRRRNITHGHICPANIVREDGQTILIDPVVGALHQTSDPYLAPETALGRMPELSADLYGLGRTIKTLMGESLSGRQDAVTQQLMLPAPRQRPPLEEVALAFGLAGSSTEAQVANGGVQHTRHQTSSGRVLKSNTPSVREATDKLTNSATQEQGPAEAPKRRGSLAGGLGIAAICCVVAVVVIKDRYPALYFELTSRVPMLAAQHSAEYETEWASRDRTRMAVVGRAGVIRREPAAVNTIVNDLLSGANPDGVNGPLMRVALADSWRSELSPVDIHAALVFSLETLVPEGQAQLSQLGDLHPGVVLAILGQTIPRNLPSDLARLPIDTLLRLPQPFGDLFSQAKAMGVQSLGDETVRGLAAIVTGNARSDSFERFLGPETNAAQTLAKVSLIVPVVSSTESVTTELLGVLGDRGGDITTLVRWFDLTDVAGWGAVRASDKLALILGNLPESRLATPQLADLLTFPLEKVRNQALVQLRDAFGDVDSERLLVTLATPTLGLSREQIIALTSALTLPPDARISFIPAWFNLQPPADAVLLILLARSKADPQDVFNIEAARFLRRSQWGAPVDLLKLLAAHPEPLARVLAYARLDPSVERERSILLERQLHEKDESCLKVLKERLGSFEKQDVSTGPKKSQ